MKPRLFVFITFHHIPLFEVPGGGWLNQVDLSFLFSFMNQAENHGSILALKEIVSIVR